MVKRFWGRLNFVLDCHHFVRPAGEVDRTIAVAVGLGSIFTLLLERLLCDDDLSRFVAEAALIFVPAADVVVQVVVLDDIIETFFCEFRRVPVAEFTLFTGEPTGVVVDAGLEPYSLSSFKYISI